MRVVIAGGGEVGFHLAKLLNSENHEIIFIDTDKTRLDYIQNMLEIITIVGDCSSIKILKEAKVENADILIAVTSVESVNLTTCIIGKKLGAKRTIARISNTEYLQYYDTLNLNQIGIDELISPESLLAREVKHLLQEPAVFDTFEFENGKLVLMGILVDGNSKIIGKSISETADLNIPKEFMIVALNRNNQTIIPRGNVIFEPGDRIYFMALEGGREKVLEFVGIEHINVKKIMIFGGSLSGAKIARRLSKYYSIKLIEENRKKCNELAKELENILVINGDVTDIDLLKQENIENMDAFVGVTDNAESNIFACLIAKEHGVKKTIALIDNIEFLKIYKTLGIDTLINKKIAAADFIFKYIRGKNVISFTSISGDVEILEFQVSSNAKITKHQLKEIDFPENAIISGVIRNQKAYITLGDFQVKPDDRVVVLAMPDYIGEVNKFF